MTTISPNLIYNRIMRAEFDLVFESGLAVGRGSEGNALQIARDGKGRAVLPGSSIAGVLRAAYARLRGEESACRFFGATVESMRRGEDDYLEPSLLTTLDSVLDASESIQRTSHLRIRHTGVVAENALYSYETSLPKSKAKLSLVLREPLDSADEVAFDEFLKDITRLLKRGLFFGGSAARGVGLAAVERVTARYYRTTDPNEYAAYLDDDYALRSKLEVDWSERKETIELATAETERENSLRLEWTFKIPRGQDVLIADGQGMEAQQHPGRVMGADGFDYWLLPGSSLRGLMRSYAFRLAVRDGKKISDTLEEFEKRGCQTDPDDLAWIFAADRKGDPEFLREIDDDYPVESLFGSLHKVGRIRISDALSKIGTPAGKRLDFAELERQGYPVQKRMHVAIDALSGGANDGLLYDDYVLTSGGGKDKEVAFNVVAIVDNPTEYDAELLAKTLRAVSIGVLRVGSSKASGRLAIEKGSFKAYGEYADRFKGVDLPENEPVGKDVAPVDPYATQDADANNEVETDDAPRGTLVVVTTKKGKEYKVKYISNKGKEIVSNPLAPQTILFSTEDASDGCEIAYRQEKGLFVEVWIPGKTKVANKKVAPRKVGAGRGGNKVAVNSLPQASPSIYGSSFYNPYTFIPFGKSSHRKRPAFQTRDEKEKDRFTGSIEIQFKTSSPLLTRSCESYREECEHKFYCALKIGEDVVVPATSVRGFLRYLTTIVTGSPLTTMEEETYLCQGRDLQLPTPENKRLGARPILARVVRPGDSLRSGVIAVGTTELVWYDELVAANNGRELSRPEAGKKEQEYWVDFDPYASEGKRVRSLSTSKDEKRYAQIKLSGRPVSKNRKHEGVYLGELKRIELPPRYWTAYESRWKHSGLRSELKAGDLVWVEPTSPLAKPSQLLCTEDIKSLQWARWGRGGVRLDRAAPNGFDLKPDARRNDGLVSTATDLFGQIADRETPDSVSFKGRVIPENLVFERESYSLENDVEMAVMAAPHLGCSAFYRNNNDPQSITEKDSLRGYKVYRTTTGDEPGKEPYRFSTQGVYDERGAVKDGKQRVNFSSDVVKPESKGSVRIALRALSREELDLVVAICRSPWRLGGGKAFGMGLLTPTTAVLRDENGEKIDLADLGKIDSYLRARLDVWNKIQIPVRNVRYPRAAERNNNKVTRGGMTWFKMNAARMKSGAEGLEPRYVAGKLADAARKLGVDNSSFSRDGVELVSGQVLPFIPGAPEKEVLYGYDLIFDQRARSSLYFNGEFQLCYEQVEPYDEENRATEDATPGENLSPNRETRRLDREKRR